MDISRGTNGPKCSTRSGWGRNNADAAAWRYPQELSDQIDRFEMKAAKGL